MSNPQTTDQTLSLEERTRRMIASYNIGIRDAVTTCENILESHDHSRPYVLLEEKLIGALKGLRRKAP